MGGYGSGMPAMHSTCEESLRIDLADPAIRQALISNISRSGTWAWSSRGRVIASIRYSWSSADARLTLKYTCNGTQVEQMITLARTTPHYGGSRWWFFCPYTGSRVRALFLPPGAREWGSRRAYGLTYQSQRDSGAERAMLQLLMRDGWPGGPALARAASHDPDPFGFREEARRRRREERRARRNHVRRIARRQRKRA